MRQFPFLGTPIGAAVGIAIGAVAAFLAIEGPWRTTGFAWQIVILLGVTAIGGFIFGLAAEGLRVWLQRRGRLTKPVKGGKPLATPPEA
jgi:hypothetical protein